MRTRTPPMLAISSSPGRVDKLAMPPFKMLRGKGGSRSRRRGAMFPTKMQDSKEPGSPKVTCIGQVRIKKKKMMTTNDSCRDAKPEARNGRCSISSWWVALLRSAGCCGGRKEDEIFEEENPKPRALSSARVQQEKKVVEKVEATIPPKNALILMRCRSAPYRASWTPADRVIDLTKTNTVKNGGSDDVHDQESSSDDASVDGDAAVVPGLSRSFSSRPLMLTRCKSEPAGKARECNGHRSGIKISLSSAAEALPFALLQSTFRL